MAGVVSEDTLVMFHRSEPSYYVLVCVFGAGGAGAGGRGQTCSSKSNQLTFNLPRLWRQTATVQMFSRPHTHTYTHTHSEAGNNTVVRFALLHTALTRAAALCQHNLIMRLQFPC